MRVENQLMADWQAYNQELIEIHARNNVNRHAISYSMVYISAMAEGCVRSDWSVWKQYYAPCR